MKTIILLIALTFTSMLSAQIQQDTNSITLQQPIILDNNSNYYLVIEQSPYYNNYNNNVDNIFNEYYISNKVYDNYYNNIENVTYLTNIVTGTELIILKLDNEYNINFW